MQRIGIVDLGSGTSRLVVYAYEPGKNFRLVDEIRETVRLGEGLADGNRLTEAGMARAVSALRLYQDFAEATDLGDLILVATSAARDAENGRAFLKKVQQLGLNVQVLSGEQEAQYGVLAAANSFTFSDAWVMDLGGGSAQLSHMKQRRYHQGQAYPLGGVRLTEKFLKSDPPKKGEVEDLVAFASKQLKPALKQMREEPLPLIAMGGTVRNLARMVQKEQGYPLDLIHGFWFSRKELENLLGRLLDLPTEKLRELDGLQEDRADVIVAGGLVFRTVLREADLDGLWISGQGLREGAFYRHFMREPHLIAEVHGFGIQNLFARYPQEPGHTHRVRQLCKQMFGALEPLHRYGPEEQQLLDHAALLHDIGMAIGYYDHHKHGEYLVLSAALPGLTHREQLLLALLVRYHRKGEPKVGPYKDVLDKDDPKLLLRLATLLRLAEFLERSRTGRIEGLTFEIEPKRVRLGLRCEVEPWVELIEVKKQRGLFKKAFERELVVEWLG
jgi:exopolyphosphatase/guanosine-5'-triphosphate,3'-diphosphate pyrophosphatase